MKRVLRIFMNCATAMSLLLCIAIVIAFIGSDYAGDQPWIWKEWNGEGKSCYFLMIAKDELRYTTYAPGLPKPRSQWIWWHVLDFNFDNRPLLPPTTTAPTTPASFAMIGWTLTIPTFELFLLAMLLPTSSVWRAWRNARRRPLIGLCVTCGYDLRATPEDQSRYPLNYEARIRAD